MESCPNLCVRSPWTCSHLTALSMWSPCLISPRFPVVSLQLTKKASPQLWSGRTLAEILLFCLRAGLMTCRNNTAFLHSSVLTNIGDTRITQKPFLQQMSLGLSTFSLFSALTTYGTSQEQLLTNNSRCRQTPNTMFCFVWSLFVLTFSNPFSCF